VGAAAGQLTSGAAESKKNSDTLATLVPAVTYALTRLRTGLDAAGAGIGELRTGLAAAGVGITELQGGLDPLSAGTQRLGDAYGAVEYGAVRSCATEGSNVVTLQLQGNTADIPDDSNG